MNDFTKEELEVIYLSYVGSSFFKESFWIGLDEKIKSMIDDYCEHVSDGYTYYKGGEKCTDFLVYVSHDSLCFLKCNKCGGLYK